MSILDSSPLFECLDQAQKHQILQFSKLTKCERGETIWAKGANVDFCALIEQGFVQMVRASGAEPEMVLEIMGPGQVFGLLGTLEGTGCPLRAQALTNVSYLQIRKQDALAAYQQSSKMKQILVSITSRRLHSHHATVAALASESASKRLSTMLLTLAESYGEWVEEGVRIKLPLTRQVLAQMTGLTTETTIRILSSWTQRNLITTHHRFITLLDLPALERVG